MNFDKLLLLFQNLFSAKFFQNFKGFPAKNIGSAYHW